MADDYCRADGDVLDQAAAIIQARARHPRSLRIRILHLALIRLARQARLTDGPHIPEGRHRA